MRKNHNAIVAKKQDIINGKKIYSCTRYSKSGLRAYVTLLADIDGSISNVSYQIAKIANYNLNKNGEIIANGYGCCHALNIMCDYYRILGYPDYVQRGNRVLQ